MIKLSGCPRLTQTIRSHLLQIFLRLQGTKQMRRLLLNSIDRKVSSQASLTPHRRLFFSFHSTPSIELSTIRHLQISQFDLPRRSYHRSATIRTQRSLMNLGINSKQKEHKHQSNKLFQNKRQSYYRSSYKIQKHVRKNKRLCMIVLCKHFSNKKAHLRKDMVKSLQMNSFPIKLQKNTPK